VVLFSNKSVSGFLTILNTNIKISDNLITNCCRLTTLQLALKTSFGVIFSQQLGECDSNPLIDLFSYDVTRFATDHTKLYVITMFESIHLPFSGEENQKLALASLNHIRNAASTVLCLAFCITWNTIFFNNLSLSFHFFVNFTKSLQLCVKRYWFMFASHCDIWLLIENCLYLNMLASQSKVCSLSDATIPFEVTFVILVVAFTIATIIKFVGLTDNWNFKHRISL